MCVGHRVLGEAAQEELEEHRQPVRRGEDAELALARLCAAPLQAHAPLLHGRNRCRARLQERVHRRSLRQGAHQVRACSLLCPV